MTPPESLTPIHAQGFFTVDRKGLIYQTIVFDYYDPEEYYAKLSHRPREYYQEMRRLYNAMQELLDQEKVVVNNKRVHPEVYSVIVDTRGDPTIAFIIYTIIFEAPIKTGLNIYENWYEETIAEYDYEAIWVFPPGSHIEEVETKTDYEVLGDENILLIWARKGDRTGGYEKIVFFTP